MEHARRLARRLTVITGLVGVVTATTVLTSGVAGAQSSTSSPSTTILRLGSNAITNEGSPSNSAGLAVFAAVCLVIAVGGAVLYLRHRRSTKG